jgi:hypothetical protein
LKQLLFFLRLKDRSWSFFRQTVNSLCLWMFCDLIMSKIRFLCVFSSCRFSEALTSTPKNDWLFFFFYRFSCFGANQSKPSTLQWSYAWQTSRHSIDVVSIHHWFNRFFFAAHRSQPINGFFFHPTLFFLVWFDWSVVDIFVTTVLFYN